MESSNRGLSNSQQHDTNVVSSLPNNKHVPRNRNDYINSLPPGVREDMLKGGKTQSIVGDAAILGASAYAVRNPLHALEIIGAPNPNNFNDIQSELARQQLKLNPVKRVKNIGTGLKRVGNVVSDIINPRQVEVAGAPGLRINAGDVADPNVMKIGLNPPPVRTAELGPFPTKRSEGSALIKRQQDALKSPEDLKLERKDFTQTYNIATQGPLKHHHKGDQYFAGKVANRTDSSTVFKMLEDQEGIVLGDKAQNIIGLADHKTYLRRTSAMESVSQQMGFKELPKTGTVERRLLDDLFKETKGKQSFVVPKDPASYGLPRGKSTGTNTWAIGLNPDGSKVTNAQKQAAYDNRFAYNNIDKSKIKYDRGGTIVSGDHIDLTHYTGIDSKDFKQRTELINLFESGEHLNLSSLQLKNKITEVYRIQENIAVNVAIRRMNFIRKHLNQLAKDGSRQAKMALSSPEATRKWIVNNPGIAGNIGWKLKKPGFKELSQPPSSRYLKEWRDGQSPLQIIFGKGASISRPKGWEAPATSNMLNKLQEMFPGADRSSLKINKKG